tara:strand:+ start:319 stop:954 length:636 start_codon:yes stop_codon:yes gene_type:complete
MKSYIEQIENKSFKNNRFIKDNFEEIIKEIKFYGDEKSKHSPDDFRKKVLDKKNKLNMFSFLYDIEGMPNKKGIAKKVMSQHNKNVSSGMMAIYETEFNDDGLGLFSSWALDDTFKKGDWVSSMSKMKQNLNNYEKFLNPQVKEETETEETETEETETETQETLTNEETIYNLIDKLVETKFKFSCELSTYLIEKLEEKRKEIKSGQVVNL